MQMRKRIQSLVLIIVMISAVLSGCTIGDTEYVLDFNIVGRTDVISINGEECNATEAKLYLCNYQNLYGNAYGINLWGYDFSTEDAAVGLEEYVKDITILQLSNILCMNQLADQMEVTLTDEEKTLVEQATEEYYASLSEEELAYIGIEKKDLKKFYTKYAVAEKLYGQLTQGVNEEVSLDEARVVRIQQIFLTDLSEAKEVEEKLEDGDDFINVAGAHNEADTVEITVARGELVDKVEEVVYALDNDEQSGMIKVEGGYYFVKCLSKNEEELTEKNKENIIAKRRKEQFDDVFSAFVDESELEINQTAWDKITVDTSGKITTDSFFEVYDSYFAEE